jgi:hypothetical protein
MGHEFSQNDFFDGLVGLMPGVNLGRSKRLGEIECWRVNRLLWCLPVDTHVFSDGLWTIHQSNARGSALDPKRVSYGVVNLGTAEHGHSIFRLRKS